MTHLLRNDQKVEGRIISYAGDRYSGRMSPNAGGSEVLGRNFNTSLLVLSSLAGGAKHGYALVKDVSSFAGVHLAPGTLYEALARLHSKKLITPVESDDRRRPYRITALGESVLAECLQEQRRITDVGMRRLRNAWTYTRSFA